MQYPGKQTSGKKSAETPFASNCGSNRATASGRRSPLTVPVLWIRPSARRSLETSRKENAVAFAADFGVVDDGCCRVGHEPETVPGAQGRGRGDGDGYIPDLEEVPGKMVHGVMHTD